jgi:hypothetical protein
MHFWRYRAESHTSKPNIIEKHQKFYSKFAELNELTISRTSALQSVVWLCICLPTADARRDTSPGTGLKWTKIQHMDCKKEFRNALDDYRPQRWLTIAGISALILSATSIAQGTTLGL